VTRTDPTENRQAPIAARERRLPQASTADTHTKRDIVNPPHRHRSNQGGSVNVSGAQLGNLHAHVTPHKAVTS
jgi:hypothetical protein